MISARFGKYVPIDGVAVIGLGYRAQHGKDFAASIIASSCGLDAHRWAFSDAITAVVRASHGMGKRDPGLLQRVGYEMRLRDPSVWLDAVYGAIDDRRPTLAIVTGVRFTNEADFIKAMGGAVVCVSRQNEDGQPFVASDRDPEHPTEHGLDGYDFDYTLQNVTGRPNAFRRTVLEWFGRFAAERDLPTAHRVRAGILDRDVRSAQHEGHPV